MSLSKGTKSWKQTSYLLLALVLIWWAVIWYYYGAAFVKNKEINKIQAVIVTQQEKLNSYYAQTGFNEFLAVKDLEKNRTHLPWSTYINKILEILDKVKSVDGDEDTENTIELSDFQVNLQELSLNGIVRSLKTLYGSENKTWLLQSFEELDFLKDITVRKYERKDVTVWKKEENSELHGFAFTLSAKVVNDARESGTNQ